MFKEQIEKIKDLVKSKDKTDDSKRKIENLVVFLIILIITIIIINTIWKNDNKENENNNSFKELASNITDNKDDNNSEDLEEKLESILSKMEGVGKVKVLITYSQTSEVVAMYNESKKETSTQEEDSEGGNRIVQENDTKKEVIYTDENGASVPATQTIINPKVEGAIVIAQGANDANIKTNIIAAVEAITGVATHKIQVFEMSEN